ncbi:hypothetical protein FPV67DRAFT_988314 [Lyophyllum atratum]|nr:hypothetical protein FPV67DRAFT_988314 [Lyophyllum atratum]
MGKLCRTGEGAGPNARAAFDHVIFKERLGCIVRSKEGKMVNVTSPLPFNLHNKPRALIDIMSQGSYMSSSSRSASTSTFHESQSPLPERRRTSRPPPLRLRSGLRITPLHSEPPSRSTSRSRSSAPSSSKDVGEDGHGEGGGGEPVPERVPGVLGVRLVRGYDVGYGLIGRRGRAKVKKDADSEVGEDAPKSPERAGDASGESGAGV